MTRVNASRHAMRGGSGLPWWPAEGITWLLRDEFAMGRPAGSLNGTAAEPGPGTRTVRDVESKTSISGGVLVLAAQASPAFNDQDVVYVDVPITRAAGRLTIQEINLGASAVDDTFFACFVTANPPNWGTQFQSGFYATLNTIKVHDTYVLNRVVAAAAVNTSYIFATALRASGYFAFIKGGIFTNWTLAWRSDTGNTAALYPAMSNFSGSVTSAFVRIPDTLWLPTPLVSDGFATTFGTSDGLGHAEGIAGGIGAGGGGVTWTQQVGTWAVGSAKANAATLGGGIAIATVSLTTANVVIGVACVRSAGDVGVVLSWSDSSNYVRALHNGTNVQLIKTVAGTPTTLVNAAATYSAGARLVVTKDDTKYRVYYNNALVGTEQTIADAGIISNTLHGLFSTDVSNTLDDFVVYARGNEGQYASLDRYAQS